VSAAVSTVAASRADADSSLNDAATLTVNPVVDWNKTLLTIVRTPGANPATVHPTRSFAIMHAAIYDAVNAIDKTHRAYLVQLTRVSRTASEDAAAASAAHQVLVALYPNFQTTLDAQLQNFLTQIKDGADKAEGLRVGHAVASSILALRDDDGSGALPIPFVFGSAPGNYQSTPPNLPKQPQFTHWSRVTPFLLERANRFRPGHPPALDSEMYADAFNEVKLVGIANSATASADQALTGKFWNGPIQNYWNEITQTAALAHKLTTAQSARLFALLDLTIADSVIAFYDAKYTYQFWRPVTAIRAADTDGNAQTLADPAWLPQSGNSPPDPSYPGAHAVISGAGAFVLTKFFRSNHFDFNVTSEVLPGVERHFNNFSAAEQEASLSRVFAGVHFRFDETTGEGLGREVADFAVDHFLTPVHHQDRDGDRDDDRDDDRED